MGETMEAGRELDALVAERVLGVRVFHSPSTRHVPEWRTSRPKNGWLPLLPYSTDIAAAWEVVEEVQRRNPGWRFSLLGGDERMLTVYRNRTVEVVEDETVAFGWHAEFFGDSDPRTNYGQRHASERADTAPLAICRAALRATTPDSGSTYSADAEETP